LLQSMSEYPSGQGALMMRREYVVAALPGRHLLSRHLTRWLREDGQACSGSGPWWLSPMTKPSRKSWSWKPTRNQDLPRLASRSRAANFLRRVRLALAFRPSAAGILSVLFRAFACKSSGPVPTFDVIAQLELLHLPLKLCKRLSSLCHFVNVATVSLSFPPFTT
jgi:hypothetical protein